MESTDWLKRHGRQLLRVGALLFLLGLLVGLAVQRFALPRLALSTHLLGIMQGTFLMVAGLVWPHLTVGKLASRIGSALAAYGCLAAWIANLCGAIWAAGGSMVPMASGGVLGTAVQELAIRILLRSSALSLIGAILLILWGLRGRAGIPNSSP
jgi:(hydroxyamino)benzene mutase